MGLPGDSGIWLTGFEQFFECWERFKTEKLSFLVTEDDLQDLFNLLVLGLVLEFLSNFLLVANYADSLLLLTWRTKLKNSNFNYLGFRGLLSTAQFLNFWNLINFFRFLGKAAKCHFSAKTISLSIKMNFFRHRQELQYVLWIFFKFLDLGKDLSRFKNVLPILRLMVGCWSVLSWASPWHGC